MMTKPKQHAHASQKCSLNPAFPCSALQLQSKIKLGPAGLIFSEDASIDTFLLSLLPQMAAKMAPQPSSLSSLPLILTDVNAPVTLVRSTSAISLTPAGPMSSEDASIDMILLSMLPQMAPQPSSPSLLPVRETVVKAPLAASAGARAPAPLRQDGCSSDCAIHESAQLTISKARGGYESSLDLGRTYSIFVSAPTTGRRPATTMPPSTPQSFPFRSSSVSELAPSP